MYNIIIYNEAFGLVLELVLGLVCFEKFLLQLEE